MQPYHINTLPLGAFPHRVGRSVPPTLEKVLTSIIHRLPILAKMVRLRRGDLGKMGPAPFKVLTMDRLRLHDISEGDCQ